MVDHALDITVLPEFVQTEGIERVLDNLAIAGATAVTTSPYVMAPADEANGAREPPGDAGAGKVRLLDRPLWGKHALFVRTAPSFAANHALYAGLRYQPAEPDVLTEREGPIVGEFVRAAKARGLEVHLQVQAAIPPGYRVQFGGPWEDDQPRLPDGRVVPGRVDRNGSLASPHVIQYGCALLRDLARAYPEVDSFRVDWPEYPPYAFDALFFDFGPYAVSAAERLGYDVERMRRDALSLHAFLTRELRDSDLAPITAPDGGRYALCRALAERPGLLDLLRFKSDLVCQLLEAYRAALPAGQKLWPQVFPPPWSLMSGFAYSRAARSVEGIGVKLYTMHWPMMLRAYGEALRARNETLSPALLARSLVLLCDSDGPIPARLEDLHYPEPQEPHPVGDAALRRKIETARAEARPCPVYPIAHAYGPLEDFARRARIAWQASTNGMWVNRYAYLSDDKLRVLGRTVAA